jgi:hypothetical protein
MGRYSSPNISTISLAVMVAPQIKLAILLMGFAGVETPPPSVAVTISA